MKNIFTLFLLIFLLTGCGEKCFNAPPPIAFELVDSNNKNLITNGTLTSYLIREENQTAVQLTKTSDDKIILEKVGYFNGTKNYTFYSNVKTFDFSIQSSEFKGGCDGYQINKLTFKNVEVTDENGYYKIVLQ